ncbi:N-myc-interactor [Lampris incognitus]|uniref:N-myc-interactor n=1 Tax=Lampris incognitus TaxID=2546036 RepID=UPI0024B52DD8|nr:N-myc-interactor [Lampris incognitus]
MFTVALGEDGAIAQAKAKLESWRAMVEKADDVKARLVLEKLGEVEAKKKAQANMYALLEQFDQCTKSHRAAMDKIQGDILKLERHNQDLMETLKRRRSELEEKTDDFTRLKQKSKIYANIPKTKLQFIEKESNGDKDSGHQIKGVFTISQRPTMLLTGGHALLTFTEEKVASQLLKMAKCSVSCDGAWVDVKPKQFILEPSVKFEIHSDVSKKEVEIFSPPPVTPEERMKDRLEISFSKPSRGGGEVEKVEYDGTSGRGKITFLNTGVAENLALMGKYPVDLDKKVAIQVDPVYSFQLCKFQVFCSTSKRTILLNDIVDIVDEEDLQDYLEIHFQKPNNYGGEIESIKYIPNDNNLQAFFVEDTNETDV